MTTTPAWTHARRIDLRTAIDGLALASAGVLVPWTMYLGRSLPSVHVIESWGTTWVGFDVLLITVLGAAGVLGLRQSHWFVPAAAATATLLCADAWFDVMTSSGTEQSVAVAMAALVELPLAAALVHGMGRALAPAAMPAVVTL